MFERYTEKARRVIFFARYEASQLGSPHIQPDHLLLGILRDDKVLADRFLRSHDAVASIRGRIGSATISREKLLASVDLPLSNESKRVFAFASEEAERLSHKHIGTEHLLLGILREDKTLAAQLLNESGITLESTRTSLSKTPHEVGLPRAVPSVPTADIAELLNKSTVEHGSLPEDVTESLRRIMFIVQRGELAMAMAEFEKARFYADEERKEREKLRLLYKQHGSES